MRHAKGMTQAGLASLLREVRSAEKTLNSEKSLLDKCLQELDDYNKFYTSLFRDVYRNLGADGAVEVPRRQVSVSSKLTYETIAGFRQQRFNDAVPMPIKPLTSQQIRTLSEVLGNYFVDTAVICRRVDLQAVRYVQAYYRLMEKTLYEQLASIPKADKAIIYVAFPHDPLMKRAVHDLWLDRTGSTEDSTVSALYQGRIKRWTLKREGKRNKADVYIVHSPSTVVDGPDLLKYAALFLQSRYDQERPDMALQRKALKSLEDSVCSGKLTREQAVEVLFSKVLDCVE
ncbi:hypothetical protein KY363_05915, partial [Candidatus Woesearchaeota archaeon]|nr:hypothetical protein [Candidatus Woesearchaeota archaeon]